jgi:pimeloyl-ACP methyl ester carboxylesterase
VAEKTTRQKMIIKRVEYRGVELCYRQAGSGPAVLLLHGFGEDGSVFNDLIPHLEKVATVLIPDLPGSGQSAAWKDFHPSIEDLAAAIHTLVEKEQIEQYIVLGHSMGGYIALAIAESFPDMIKGLGLVHSTAYADTEVRRNKRKQAIDFMKREGASAFLNLSIPGLFAEGFRQSNPAVIENLLEAGSQFSATALIGYYEAMMQRVDRIHVLQSVTCTVLFLTGSKDELIPARDVYEQAKNTQHAKVFEIEQAGHMSMLETPETFHSIILDFCRMY